MWNVHAARFYIMESDKGQAPKEYLDPEGPLRAILPRRIVIALAVASFMLSIIVLLIIVSLGLFLPETLANPTARFLFLVLVSQIFAGFFFVFYPQVISINEFELGVRIAGPLAARGLLKVRRNYLTN
jgi:hypothetical protein